MRRTALAALASLPLALSGLVGCGGSDEPAPTSTPTATTSTKAGLETDGGVEVTSCRDEPGKVLVQSPFRAVSPTRIEDVGVYPGTVPVEGAWVTPTDTGVPDLVSAVDWPDGFGAEPQKDYRWAERKEAVEELLPKGRYHLFVLVDLRAGMTVDAIDIAWLAAEGEETGVLPLRHRIEVGDCG